MNLNEYKKEYDDQWINSLTDDEIFEKYQIIKQILPRMKQQIDTSRLETAIRDFENRHNIK